MTPHSAPHSDAPLRGVRVLVTRAREDAENLGLSLQRLGAEVRYLPTISIRLLANSPDVTAALNRLGDFDWVAFTSRNAVRAVFDWLGAQHRQMPSTVRVAAVGVATARELEKHDVTPDLIPPAATAHALAAALMSSGIGGSDLLLPLGNLAGDEISRSLEDSGARVTTVRVYETVPPSSTDTGPQEALTRAEIDVVTLASPSGFRNLLDLAGDPGREALHRTHLVAIGPTTAEAIRSAGYTCAATAATPTTEGLVKSIVNLFQVEHS